MLFWPRILVVADDAQSRAVLAELFDKHNLACDRVSDAETAVLRMAQRDYDLYIVDRDLPGKSGLHFLQHVKKSDTDAEVILMADGAEAPTLLQALHAGVYDYLVKPFTSLDDVLHKVQRALEKRRILQENRHLIKYLTQANSQIDDMNRQLEAEVQARTDELKRANARLEQLTLTDDVTGLYNQRFLHPRLEEEFARARRYGESLAVIMLDLDHFKGVNDGHDHLFGSRVLRRIGELLSQQVRDTDMLVRYGGDEFVTILPHTNVDDAVLVAERLRQHIAQADLGEPGQACRCTVSAGVAGLSESATRSAGELLRAADQALYRAKAQGRNRVERGGGKLSSTATA